MTEYVTVYDKQGNMLGVLENADAIGYSLQHNDLWTAAFSLPTGDPGNAWCQAHNLISLPDDGRELGLYRIVGMPDSDETNLGGVKRYSLEHVMATLLDDILFGYHEIGGTGVTTAQVISYILARQTAIKWQLGTCEYTDQFAYKFENTDLLSALMSLGEVISGEYTWEFDTTTTPWTISLKTADADAGCGIHYLRNMQGINKSMDASGLVTRLYLLGYGEGVNQLTIKSVNSDLPYLTADTAASWGIKCGVYVDRRIEDAATLKALGLQLLDKMKNPYISYTATGIDLARLTGQSWDSFMPGKLVKALDSEHGISFTARIKSVAKDDLVGRPGDIVITIANAGRDAAGEQNALAKRMGVSELYSQGATNLYAQQFADNADPTHPAKMRVYVPSGCVRINKMLLSFDLAAFRAYETGADAGGGSVETSSEGGGGTRTSSSGGGISETLSISNVLSGESGAGVNVSSLVANTESVIGNTGSAGDVGTTAVSPGNTAGMTSAPNTGTPSANNTGSSSPDVSGYSADQYVSGEAGSHSHGSGTYSVASHSHTPGSHVHGITDHAHYISGTHSHTGGAHVHSLGGHNHGMGHTHTMGNHAHYINHSHTLTVGAHSHTVEIPAHGHNVTVPSHTHDIVYGIYEGATATGVSILVDGTAVPTGSINPDEMDIVAWLSKDAGGRIQRGIWHEIQIIPNSLTRIEANLFVQAFVQSVGGGDY